MLSHFKKAIVLRDLLWLVKPMYFLKIKIPWLFLPASRLWRIRPGGVPTLIRVKYERAGICRYYGKGDNLHSRRALLLGFEELPPCSLIRLPLGEVVRFQHRGGHWWAAFVYQKQQNIAWAKQMARLSCLVKYVKFQLGYTRWSIEILLISTPNGCDDTKRSSMCIGREELRCVCSRASDRGVS